MVAYLQGKISESKTARWFVLLLVSLTLMCGYFLADVVAPLQELLGEIFGWSETEYGMFNSGYGWFNLFLLMLIFTGMILDRLGPRFTGVMAVGVMLAGIAVKYFAIAHIDPTRMFDFWFFGERVVRLQVLVASLGFALFAVGYETFGITATKIVVRWFKGKEMALALGLNVAFARLGTFLALAVPLPLVKAFGGKLGTPILFGMILLAIGFVAFMLYVVMDRKLDAEKKQEAMGDDERLHARDIFSIIRLRGFWYIAILCLLFYAAVNPFVKFMVSFVGNEFPAIRDYSGWISALFPVGTLLLTPLFGGIYDRKGKGASMMILGALLLVFIYTVFSIPLFSHWTIAVLLMFLLGVAYSLVPSAMWPSVPKIIPEKKLGTAYALIFWVQGWGLAGIPLLIGWVLDQWGKLPSIIVDGVEKKQYDYTIPILIFLGLSLLAVLFGVLLKRENKAKGYGLEEPNMLPE